jgi:hypothetical protein
VVEVKLREGRAPGGPDGPCPPLRCVRFEVLFTGPAESSGMAPDRETVTEIIVAVAAVVLFAAGIFVVGTMSEGNIDGIMLVGAIAGFIVVMAGIGVAFAYR